MHALLDTSSTETFIEYGNKSGESEDNSQERSQVSASNNMVGSVPADKTTLLNKAF
jgi:hypothetical protein